MVRENNEHLWLLAAFAASRRYTPATPDELRAGDQQVAEEMWPPSKEQHPFKSIRSARCIASMSLVLPMLPGQQLPGRASQRSNSMRFCLAQRPDLSMRLVRTVTIHVERVPPNTTMSTATLVAGALAKAFPLPEALGSKKVIRGDNPASDARWRNRRRSDSKSAAKGVPVRVRPGVQIALQVILVSPKNPPAAGFIAVWPEPAPCR